VSGFLNNIFSRGPFSAVRPYIGGGEAPVPSKPDKGEEAPVPDDRFAPGDGADASEGAPPKSGSDEMSRGGRQTATQAALAAFPQVVHLLVDPAESWGEDLSKSVGLPLVSLQDGTVDNLAERLSQPEYAGGFILEGFPTDTGAAEKLDHLLSNVSPESHRVVGWQLENEKHQEVLDHYMDLDLLWMVPDAEKAESAQENLLSCLHGLPMLN